MTDNGRVTTREFYDELIKVRKEITSYHEEVIVINERVENHRTDINTLKKRSNIYDVVNGVGVVIAVVWATIRGNN